MDFARNEQGFCVGFAWNLILFSFVREREGYKHHADCTVEWSGVEWSGVELSRAKKRKAVLYFNIYEQDKF